MTTIRNAGAAAALSALIACGGEPMPDVPALGALADVTPAEWAALSERRLFFGHQSVGGNVLDGVADVLADHPGIRLRVVQGKVPEPGGGFYHALVGRNVHPDEKTAEFVQLVDAGMAAGGVAMLKYCYVDINEGADPRVIFARYRDRIAELKARHPDVLFVHFTMPLWEDEGFWLYHWGRARGFPMERDRNVLRNEYNRLLLAEFGGREPVFDIAALESRGPDGRVHAFRRKGRMVPTLAPEYTDDGGHLNAVGRRMIAEQLLVFLARLPRPGAAAAGPARS